MADCYSLGEEYWTQQPATVDGMLGGYGDISDTDINGSQKFLNGILKLLKPPGRTRCLDCGAGIGRISKNLLQHHFQAVDLVEQNQGFLDKAKENLKESKKAGNFFCSGLQNFTPEEETYDVIWVQWVIIYLNNEDLTQFFIRCGKGLRENGMIIVKENITSSGEIEEDEEDGSVTRSDQLMKDIFKQANLDIIREWTQPKFPKKLYPVKLYALRPLK